MTLFDFEHSQRDGFHQYATSGQVALDAVWPGLWELEYPDDLKLNPFLRFGINNGDGEPLAVWRALSWAVTADLVCHAVPNYYGDEAALALGIDPNAVDHVDWDYEIDVATPEATFEEADRGYVRARHVVPLRPEPTEWERTTRSKARLLPLTRLGELLSLGPVVSEATSHITLFGLSAANRQPQLLAALRTRRRPKVAKVLDVADVIVEMAVDHDGFGRSYLVVRSRRELDHFDGLVQGFEKRFEDYRIRCSELASFEDFATAIGELLQP